MRQLQLLIFLTLRMIIYPTNLTRTLVKTNIIESLETRPCDSLDSMVGNEEVLLPSHEQMLLSRSLVATTQSEVRILGLFGQGSPSREPCPVLQVDFLATAP